MNWQHLMNGEGKIGDIDQRALVILHASLLFAVRDGFDVNAVPPEVVEALAIARGAVVAADLAIRGLGAVVVGVYDKAGLEPDGKIRPPAPTPTAEELAAADVKTRSSHRPSS